jgi:hypothetical protein
MKAWLLGMFSAEGTVSWTRVMGTGVVGNIMLVWTISCLKHGFEIQPFPESCVAVILTVIGGKVIQSFSEKKDVG